MRRSRLKGDDGQKDLDRMGHPDLQPRHPDHPNCLKHFPTLPPEQPRRTADGRATNAAVAPSTLSRLSAGSSEWLTNAISVATTAAVQSGLVSA